ncbi:NAD(P)-dependent dehydrogenase (short-subunit alcohol dehydrogenase family) [Deinococcus sp. HSC-46F16]|uniref:SDR family NAD(P)-dependent oxidoreductase n=1 Tax=Deinococcus sp. HSC-46F16 TaxID=2910968 RepID=UPI0020A1F3E5|nr:SDR family NAD(P)-dependent oxidoreductase [Deinococcus sp. HSC-46F16]MCP2014765.1 NAD(P)-dependent dehydrogenase (short-subunit alcohol dehydrogenase family) [Deinococcus sp. HSC-46F16]
MHTLIVGATGGIGAATARAFAARGDRLTLSGRDAGRLSALAAELGADSQAADLGYESHVRALLEGVGELDTLVYAAGAALPGPVQEADPAAVRAVWNANYFGALWVLKHGLRRMGAGGRVYLLGARPELVTARGFSQYAASKAALRSAAEIARLEARGVGITVVLPPAVDTGLWTQVGRVPRGAIPPEAVAAAIALDRDGLPQPELRVEG